MTDKIKRLVVPIPKGGVSLATQEPPKGLRHSLPLTLSIKIETPLRTTRLEVN
jgi:hypothetical protein